MNKTYKKYNRSLFLFLSIVIFLGFIFSCKKVSETRSSSYQYKAIEKINFGLYNDALEELNLAVKANPSSVEGYYTRCMVKMELDRFKEALKDCGRAVSINKKSYQGYYYRGLVYLYFYEYEESLADFKNAKHYALKDKNNDYARRSHKYIQALRKRLQKEDSAV